MEKPLSPAGESILTLKAKRLVPRREVRGVPEFTKFGESEDNHPTCPQES